jgi:hypothetical protein
VYGKQPEQWLRVAAGIASGQSNLVVYDGQAGRVHVVDTNFEQRTLFGRLGGGPGEFARTRSILSRITPDLLPNYLAASDSLVYIYDGRSVQTFGSAGDFVRRVDVSRLGVGTAFSGVRRLAVTSRGLVLAWDAVHFRTPGEPRRLETWLVGPDSLLLVHALEIRTPPSRDGAYSQGEDQARPVWSAFGHCVVVGNGAAPWLVRIDIRNMAEDTLQLPAVPPREPIEISDSMAEYLERFGFIGRPQATASARWSDMIIDPDGHVWVLPAKRTERAGSLLLVYRIDPAGGVHEERVPAFPDAFGAPGVFYAREWDRETDEAIIREFRRN